MNAIENGVKKILKAEKIVTDNKCCFKVTFVDYDNRTRTKEVMDLEKFKHASWME